ncbi:MAG: AAA family ATPase [Sedimentitalea sp.]
METAQDMLRSPTLIRKKPGCLTMIAAVPGAGKTQTIQPYVQETGAWIVHTATAGEGKIWDIVSALVEQLDMGGPNSRRLKEGRARIAAEIGERLLTIDEARYLAFKNPRFGTIYETYEWLRAMAEQGGFSISFCGDLALLKAVDYLLQLRRRRVRPVVVRAVPILWKNNVLRSQKVVR